jgi:hypothetical protein
MYEGEQGKPHIIPALYHDLNFGYFVKTVTVLHRTASRLISRLLANF